MINGKLRSDIDKLWEEFWTGGITNPLTVIEQISFLMFLRLLDIQEEARERAAKRKGGKPKGLVFNKDQQYLRWKKLGELPAAEMLEVMRDKVFPFLRERNAGTTFGDYMKDAQLMIQKPSLLVAARNMVDKLPLTQGDVKGDLYEYLLSKLTTAGINGQFRTPRHVIDLMVELVDPKPSERIADPACGTAGFLTRVNHHLFKTHTSKSAILKDDEGNEFYPGDKLSTEERKHIQRGMFHGFDFDSTMLRIAAMNLMLHGVENPDIHYQDTLSNSFPERFPQSAENGFDVVLANPPFKGSLDEEDVHPSLTRVVKTKKPSYSSSPSFCACCASAAAAPWSCPTACCSAPATPTKPCEKPCSKRTNSKASSNSPAASSNPTPASPPPSWSSPKAARPTTSSSTTSKPTASPSTTNAPPSKTTTSPTPPPAGKALPQKRHRPHQQMLLRQCGRDSKAEVRSQLQPLQGGRSRGGGVRATEGDFEKAAEAGGGDFEGFG
jgi:hypothetical protein